MAAAPWRPPEDAPPVAWRRIEASLRAPQRGPRAHQLSPRIPQDSRRAAVGVILWGDALGARKLVLVQRGFGAPRHAGELAFPGGMAEPRDRDLPATARREVAEETGVAEGLWELGCFPDGVAKDRIRFTPVFFRWDAPRPTFRLDRELEQILMLPLAPLMDAPWTVERLERYGIPLEVPRLELPQAPLWGATAFVLKAWLDLLAACPEP